MGGGPSIAVCLMASDEQESLPGCLESIAGGADAIYLTDTGSSDATIAIARSFGARVREFKWKNDFAAARNASIQGVAEDWILTLDADDRMPAGQLSRIRESLEPKSCAATLRYQVDFGFTPLRAVKLLRNGLEANYEGLIHEDLSRWLDGRLAEGWKVQDLQAELIHTGYSPEAFPRKLARNLPLLKAEWEREACHQLPAHRAQVGAELGLALAHAGQANQAREFLENLLQNELSAKCGPAELLEIFINLLWVLDHTDNPGARLQMARALEERFCHSTIYQLHRGLAELSSSNFAQARSWLERFRDREPVYEFETPIPVEYLGAGLWRDLGICHRGEGNSAAAAECFRRCVELDPGNREYQLRLLACSR